MKKIIVEFIQSNFSTFFPGEISEEIKSKLADKEYKAKQFFEEYGFLMTL